MQGHQNRQKSRRAWIPLNFVTKGLQVRSDGCQHYYISILYVCIVITHSKNKDQHANPARGQLNRENEHNISLSPFASEKMLSRDGCGGPVPPQPAHLQTQAESGAYLRDSSEFRGGVHLFYLNRHTPSGYRPTAMGPQKHKNETQKIVDFRGNYFCIFCFISICPAMGWVNKTKKYIKMRRRFVEYTGHSTVSLALQFEI